MKKPIKKEVEDDGFAKESALLREKITEKYDKEYLNLLKKIVYEISVVGLTEEQACTVVGYDYVKFISDKKKCKLLSRFFIMKGMEWKRDMMKTLSNKARNGDDKLAQYLLGVRFPDEFNSRKGIGGPKNTEADDRLGQAISFIQKQNGGGVVDPDSGRAFLESKKNDISEVPVDVHEALSSRANSIVTKMSND